MKNKIYLIILIIVLVILNSKFLYSQQQTITIRLSQQTGQDAFIGDNYPTTNWGYHPDLVALRWTSNFNPLVSRSLFQFYLNNIPSNAEILDARLSLYANLFPVNSNHYGTNSAFLRRVTSTWIDTIVTWPSQPSYTTINQVYLPQSNFALQDYLNIDVKNLIQDMIQFPNQSFGFILMLNDEYPPFASMNFASGDCFNPNYRPKLDITFNLVGINAISNEIPSKYKMYQNYPNPFNPVTNIKFDLPQSSFIKISVFDILGRELETLVDENLSAGTYNVIWDANNYASGEYFYRIITSDFVETKRMSLTK
ncbi:MAG TPA: hypothetical protein DCY06_06365 [Bacteroidetes bacterium]|nr:hypothetical protein [Bacteroidota bacterium]HRK00279.1 DNRLRE domain-containing protein [Ignavibacteria bacterium]